MGQAEPLVENQDSGRAEDAGNGTSMEEILASIRRIIASENNAAGDTEIAKHESLTNPAGKQQTAASALPADEMNKPVYKTDPAPSAGNGISLSSLAASVKRKVESGNSSATADASNGLGEPIALVGDRDLSDTASRETISSELSGSKTVSASSLRPVAQTPSSSPGGLAALAARIKSETQKTQPLPDSTLNSASAAPSSEKSETSVETGLHEPAADPSETNRKPVSLSDIAAMASRQSDLDNPVSDPEVKSEETELHSGQDALQTMKDPPRSAFGDVAADAIRQSMEKRQEEKPFVEKPVEEERSKSRPFESHGEPDSVAVSNFREALVSPSTQASVSGSMHRLTKAIETVDAAHVEAVLRPMLKEWLDDNLPTLVEKLVSEEISRIANAKSA